MSLQKNYLNNFISDPKGRSERTHLWYKNLCIIHIGVCMKNVEVYLSFNGQNSETVIGTYVDMSMADDISQTGWNLCNCDDDKFARSIGKCKVLSSTVETENAKVVVELSGTDEELMEQTIQEYLDGFEYHIRPTALELYSRTGSRYSFSLNESDFGFIEINGKDSVQAR